MRVVKCLGVVCVLSVFALGCEDATVQGGGAGYGADGVGSGDTGSVLAERPGDGVPGSLTGSHVDEAEWEAYLERSATELEERDVVVAPWAKHLPATQSQQAIITQDQVTLPNTQAGQADYRVGDVIVSDNIEANKVFLRRVTAVDVQGNTTSYQTEDAAVTDIVYRGALTERPTEQAPGFVHQGTGFLTVRQALGALVGFFPVMQLGTLARIVEGPWKFTFEDVSVQIKLDFLKYAEFDNSRTQMEEFEIEIDWGGISRALGFDTRVRGLPVALGHPWHPSRADELYTRYGTRPNRLSESQRARIPAGYPLTTSCESVMEALTVIRETPTCDSFYSGWLRGLAPEVPGGADEDGGLLYREGVLANVDVMEHTVHIGNQGNNRLRQLVCVSNRGRRHAMPFPEQTQWAQQNCGGGVLDKFDFVATFAPEFRVSQADVEVVVGAEAEAGADRHIVLDANQVRSLQDEDTTLSTRNQVFRFFVGWLPVVMNFKVSLVSKPFKIEGEGKMKFTVDNPLRVFLDLHPEIHYVGGSITSADSWDTSESRYDGGIELPSKEQFSLEDIQGSLKVTNEPIGLKTELLFYDAAGFYLSGPTIYNSLQVNPPDFNDWREGEVGDEAQDCLFHIKSGVKVKGGFKGKIPLTSMEAEFEFRNKYDSCSGGSQTLCNQVCFQFVPLQVYAQWDKPEDVDLYVFDPNNRQSSYSQDSIPDASHRSSRGCNIESRCQGPTYDEGVVWSGLPESGSYTVRLQNRGDESVTITGYVRAQTNTARVYFNEPIELSLGAGEVHEFEFDLAVER